MCNSLDVVIVTVIIVIFFNSPSTAVKSDDEGKIDKKQLKQTFDKLLYQVVDLNQQRLDAINKVLQLEEYFPSLRSSGEARHDDSVAMFLVRDFDSNYENNDNAEKYAPPHTLINYLREKDASDRSEEGLSIDVLRDDLIFDDKTVERTAVLRGWQSCRKSAIKTCRKACVSVSKNVCSDYKCSSHMKKSFKKECKRTCEDKFND